MLYMKVNILYTVITALFLASCSTSNQSPQPESMFQKYQRCGFQKSGNKVVEENGNVAIVHDPKLIDQDCAN